MWGHLSPNLPLGVGERGPQLVAVMLPASFPPDSFPLWWSEKAGLQRILTSCDRGRWLGLEAIPVSGI